jgi:hypothetical protein
VSLKSLASSPLGAALLKVKITRAMRAIDERTRKAHGQGDRKHELHVSDFTASDKSFCARSVVRRYLDGEGERKPTFVQFDGKFREEKWKLLFQEAGILVDYQMEVRAGRLVGHPDFIIDLDGTRCIVELTGHDSQVSEKMRWARVAVKCRQSRLYQVLTKYRDSAYVIVENKGNNEFDVLEVKWDAEKAAELLGRVRLVNAAVDLIESGKPAPKVIAAMKPCQKKKCHVCEQYGRTP